MNDTMTVERAIEFLSDLFCDSGRDMIEWLVEEVLGVRLEYLGDDRFKVEGE